METSLDFKQMFEVCCGFYTCLTELFAVVIFQVLNSHMWFMATLRDNRTVSLRSGPAHREAMLKLSFIFLKKIIRRKTRVTTDILLM